MSLVDNLKSWALRMLLPSNWVEWLKGKKRLLGVLSLVIWFCLYAAPTIFPQAQVLLGPIQAIRNFLAAAGIQLDASLFNAGAGLTVVGLCDWVAKHIISDAIASLLKKLEAKALPAGAPHE